MNGFLDKIQKANTIAILGHIRPDGDCVGSCLGLYNYIMDNYQEKQVVVFLQPIMEKFKFLKGADIIRNVPDRSIYDLAISLDCGDTDRHGEFSGIYAGARDTICLDHHQSNQGFGNYYYCDAGASSTCEVLYRYISHGIISTECAECLYLGMVHDTGVFKYPATSKETMAIAGELIEKGVRTQYIIDETFYKVTFNQNKLTGRALLDARLYLDGKVIGTRITTEMFEQYNTTKSDTDGIIDKLRVTDGVEVAIFAYQLNDETYKFSLRSVSWVDVSKISVAFGGGGHIRAAGFEVKGDYEENLSKILSMIEEQL
ncbi:MAG: bifunctional oligoribonuclease/PAP phosphatase NrnA [Lachnospiraceae bacterium]|nr:bifunctional oligoribonuclease/PAP phosphatase NrnA [Lachnospiraceae bacterium]